MDRDRDKVLPFRLVEGGRSAAPPQGLFVACHCMSTLYEVINGGEVRCARCGCALPARWQWDQADAPR